MNFRTMIARRILVMGILGVTAIPGSLVMGIEPILKKEDCDPPKRSLFAIRKSPNCTTIRPRRILVVCASNQNARIAEQSSFARLLAQNLRSQGVFDVVDFPNTICSGQLPMRSGVFDEYQLIAYGHRYNVDAVLYVEVNRLSMVNPVAIQTSSALISIPESVALVSTNQNVDLSDVAMKNAYLAHAANATPEHDVETQLMSPTLLMDFSSLQMSHRIASIWGPVRR